MESNGISLNDFKEALAGLPSEFEPINEEFLEKYKTEIEIIKKFHEPFGGVYVISTYDVLVRLPSELIYHNYMNIYAENDFIGAEEYLIESCLLYPTVDILQKWIDSGCPGIVKTISWQIIKLAGSIKPETRRL